MISIGASKPMIEYNKGSDLQKKWIEDGLGNMTTIVDNLPNSDHLTIMDLGCSQGKNSLFVFNELFNTITQNGSQILTNLKEISIFHEDLPNNDFEEFSSLINNDESSYAFHPLIQSKSIETEINFIGKSYYEPILERNTVDLGFCYTSLHWITNTFPLEYGILFERAMESQSTIELYERQGYDNLMSWLELRHDELKSGGILSFNILTKCTIDKLINSSWIQFAKSKQLPKTNWDKVRFGAYNRTKKELDNVLNDTSDRFQAIYKKSVHSSGHLTKLAFRAVAYNQIVSGLMQSQEQLGAIEQVEDFVDEYINFVYSNDFQTYEIDTISEWVVLKKL